MQGQTIPTSLTINYLGQTVEVRVHDLGHERKFIVFLPGEDGNLVLSLTAGESGKENWLESGQQTQRADEIGVLIEDSIG